MRTLGTLIAPTSGSATVAGIPLTQENGVEIRRRIAIMPESPGLYLRLSAAENLECFAELYETPCARDRIDRALRAVDLADRAGDPCGALSKRLRQRVALARALLSDPQVLFLDEPTSGLDPVAARDVHVLIDDLRRRGVTIFLTTHRLEEAERLCDRVAILNTTLRAIGRPGWCSLSVSSHRPGVTPAAGAQAGGSDLKTRPPAAMLEERDRQSARSRTRRPGAVLLPGVSRRSSAGSRSVITAIPPRGTAHGTGAGETLGTQGILSGRGGPSVQARRQGREPGLS